MNVPANPQAQEFSLDPVDVRCDSFERECRSGQRPLIEKFVQEVEEPDRSSLLKRLVHLDVSYRDSEGQAGLVDEYLARFPNDCEVIRSCFSPDSESAEPSLDSTVTHGVDIDKGQFEAPFLSLGRYQLQDMLGWGGFGEVWKAWDPTLQRQVAIKTMRSGRTVAEADIENFLDEGRKLAQLEHAAIVPVYDVGHEQDQCFIVSKLIDGVTFENWLRDDTRLNQNDGVKIIARMADAVHYAHTQGLVHRDIKPANILLDQEGQSYLADFGLAITEEEQLDEGPSIVGTYAYMSPEQVRGASNLADARSDIYSLGVVLYRLLTGRVPFRGRNRSEWEQQIRARPARPLRTINDDIPAPLEEVCLKCLDKDIDKRYRTAKDFAIALREAISEPTAPSRPKSQKWGMLAGGVVALTLVVAALATAMRPAEETALPEKFVPQIVNADNPNAIAVKPIMWPLHDGISTYHVARNGQSIELSCEQYGLIGLADLSPANTEFSVEVSQINWTGPVGIFWGWGQAGDNANRNQVQTIHFRQIGNREMTLQRTHMLLDRVTAKTKGIAKIAQEVIPNPGGGTHLLTLRFARGSLIAVEWDGQACPKLTTDVEPMHWAVGDESGPVGVFVCGTNATLSVPHLDGKALLMKPDAHP